MPDTVFPAHDAFQVPPVTLVVMATLVSVATIDLAVALAAALVRRYVLHAVYFVKVGIATGFRSQVAT